MKRLSTSLLLSLACTLAVSTAASNTPVATATPPAENLQLVGEARLNVM